MLHQMTIQLRKLLVSWTSLSKATMKDSKLLEQIGKVLKVELDANKAERILRKIENIV